VNFLDTCCLGYEFENDQLVVRIMGSLKRVIVLLILSGMVSAVGATETMPFSFCDDILTNEFIVFSEDSDLGDVVVIKQDPKKPGSGEPQPHRPEMDVPQPDLQIIPVPETPKKPGWTPWNPSGEPESNQPAKRKPTQKDKPKKPILN